MKKILLSFLILSIAASAAYLVYLNEAVLPQKIRAALVDGLKASTGKDVEIDSARLDLFRGLVIKNLTISDTNSAVFYAKDVSCRFIALPLFKKEIIVTSIRFDSPKILLERYSDNSVNMIEMFFRKPIRLLNGRYGVNISRVVLSRGEITFKDRIFEPPAVKELNKANIDIRFHAYRTVFDAVFEIASEVPSSVKASGEYRVLKKELSLHVEARDFSPKDFAAYCDGKRFNLPEGRLDLSADAAFKDNILNVDTDISGVDTRFRLNKIDAALTGTVKAKIKYDIPKKELIYTGTAAVKNLALYNLGPAEKIYDIRGNVSFSDKSFTFNDITATVFGVPVRAYTVIKDLRNPVLNIDVVSDVRLSVLKSVLKDKFNIRLPFDMAGEGNLKLYMQSEDIVSGIFSVKGSLSVNRAMFKADFAKAPFENVTGRFDFTQNRLVFKNLVFKYDKAVYAASGAVTNFEKPGVQLDIDSAGLSAKALFSADGKNIALSSVEGRMGVYGFSVQGNADISDPKNPEAELRGTLTFELAEGKEPYKSLKDKIRGMKPFGYIRADFALKGGLNSLKDCAADVEIRSDRLSLNGVRMDDFVSSFTRRGDVYNIKRIYARAYGGTVEGNGLVEAGPKEISYQLNLDARNIRLEELKKATPFRDKDVSGIMQSHFGMKGFSDDSSRFTAWGKINISKGRLWELNLFRGIGTLLLRSDFSSVIFEEGSCDIAVKDKTVFLSDLILKSSLIDLYGSVRLTFDKKITASLKTEFTDEGIDAARTGGIAGAIERYSVIEADGTFDEPNCRIKPELGVI